MTKKKTASKKQTISKKKTAPKIDQFFCQIEMDVGGTLTAYMGNLTITELHEHIEDIKEKFGDDLHSLGMIVKPNLQLADKVFQRKKDMKPVLAWVDPVIFKENQ
jgi:hypothetical protein